MSRRYSEHYYRPHSETRLAFEAKGIFYLCRAPRRTVINDPNMRRIYEKAMREGVEQSFPSLPKSAQDFLVAQELQLAAERTEKQALREALEKLSQGVIDLGGAQPRRPHTLIIATKVLRLHAHYPTEKPFSIWTRAAKHFSDGHPATGRLGALDHWGVRSACNAFWDITCKEDRSGALVAKRKRRAHRGRPHDWDRNLLDFSEDAGWMHRNSPFYKGMSENEVFTHMMLKEAYQPLDAMDRMYKQAISDPRFKGLRGEGLADRIDEIFGFEASVNRILTKQLFRDIGIPETDFITTVLE